MKRLLLLLLCSGLLVPMALADDTAYMQKGQGFLKALEEDGVDAEAVRSLRATLTKLGGTELDANTDFIGEGLFTAYPDYRKAIKAWYRDYYKKAASRLMKVSIKSDNDYLVAHANYFLARTYLQQGLYERAEGILGELVASELKYFHRDYEVKFYHGLSQGQLLWREKAGKTFAEFIKNYPKAPERFRMLANKIVAELKIRGENELYDLSDRMSLVQRWLGKQHSGKTTQKKENEIVEILNRLIKQAEKQEQSSST